MNCTIIKKGLNSFEFKTKGGVNVRINFASEDNYTVEDNVTNNLLISYEDRIKKSVEDFVYTRMSQEYLCRYVM